MVINTIKWPALLNNEEKDVTCLSLGRISALKTCDKSVSGSPEISKIASIDCLLISNMTSVYPKPLLACTVKQTVDIHVI